MVLFQINFFAGFIITSVKMSTRNDWLCGGDTKVEIISPINCITWNEEFERDDNVYWTSDRLGTCNGKKIDTSKNVIKFKLITTTYFGVLESFCPKYVTFMIDGGIEYQSNYMDHWHDQNDNYKTFYAYK